jgi:hypothetical protein
VVSTPHLFEEVAWDLSWEIDLSPKDPASWRNKPIHPCDGRQ